MVIYNEQNSYLFEMVKCYYLTDVYDLNVGNVTWDDLNKQSVHNVGMQKVFPWVFRRLYNGEP